MAKSKVKRAEAKAAQLTETTQAEANAAKAAKAEIARAAKAEVTAATKAAKAAEEVAKGEAIRAEKLPIAERYASDVDAYDRGIRDRLPAAARGLYQLYDKAAGKLWRYCELGSEHPDVLAEKVKGFSKAEAWHRARYSFMGFSTARNLAALGRPSYSAVLAAAAHGAVTIESATTFAQRFDGAAGARLAGKGIIPEQWIDADGHEFNLSAWLALGRDTSACKRALPAADPSRTITPPGGKDHKARWVRGDVPAVAVGTLQGQLMAYLDRAFTQWARVRCMDNPTPGDAYAVYIGATTLLRVARNFGKLNERTEEDVENAVNIFMSGAMHDAASKAETTVDEEAEDAEAHEAAEEAARVAEAVGEEVAV